MAEVCAGLKTVTSVLLEFSRHRTAGAFFYESVAWANSIAGILEEVGNQFAA